MTDSPEQIRAAIEATKPKRKQRGPNDMGSKTKPKGSPVVGNQAKTLFGQPGAPKPGITKEAARLKVRAAELAAKLQVDFLEAVDDKVSEARRAGASAAVIEQLTTNVLNLMKDALDREFGKAGASLDLTSSDGTAKLPNVIRLVGPEKPTDG